MARRSYEIKVGEFTYQGSTLPGVKGLFLFNRLIKQVGPILGQGLEAYDSEKGTIETDLLSTAVESLASKLDSEEVVNLVESFLSDMRVNDGKKIKDLDIDEHFSGRLMSMFKVLFHVLKENYSDFLPEGAFDLTGLKSPTEHLLG